MLALLLLGRYQDAIEAFPVRHDPLVGSRKAIVRLLS
jgi:hypothetical protein